MFSFWLLKSLFRSAWSLADLNQWLSQANLHLTCLPLFFPCVPSRILYVGFHIKEFCFDKIYYVGKMLLETWMISLQYLAQFWLTWSRRSSLIPCLLYIVVSVQEQFSTGGTLWFTDLTAPDSTWIMPVSLGLLNLLIVEVCWWDKQDDSKRIT